MKTRSKEKTDKWIAGVSPDDAMLDVAARSLQTRLAAVLHYLPLAAEQGKEETDYVHLLRVWSRRGAAALKLYADLLPRRRLAWMRKQLKRIRRAATEARDCDVLAMRLAKGRASAQSVHWRDEVRSERARAQKPIIDIYQRLAHKDRFERRIAKLLMEMRPSTKGKRQKGIRFGDWAGRRFRPFFEGFWKAAPLPETGEEGLHQFRIRAKKLRYVMELLAGAFPPVFSQQLYPLVVTLQDKLGEINDLALARTCFNEKVEEGCNAVEEKYLHKLLTDQKIKLDQALHNFHAWWNPQLQETLRSGFLDLLN